MILSLDSLLSAYDSNPLTFWLLASVLGYALATNLLWWFQSNNLLASPAVGLLVQAGRLFFYLGIPYLALGGWPREPFQGLLLLKDMGLVGFGLDWPISRWLQAAGLTVGLGLVAFLLLGYAWTHANRQSPESRLAFSARPWWALLVDGFYLEIHWAFYRAGLAIILDDLYTGVVLGLILVFVEWASSPYWRRGWHKRERAAAQWLRAGLALVSALLFVLTRNLWV
jgi:hypothetical protein